MVERQGEHALLRLEGDLSGRLWTDMIREHLEDHYVDDGVRLIQLDVAPVGFIDNYGVATLIALYKESRDRGKRFSVVGAQGQVQEKLRTTGVLKMLEGSGGAGS
jgi:anti-anti-sigma factor